MDFNGIDIVPELREKAKVRWSWDFAMAGAWKNARPCRTPAT